MTPLESRRVSNIENLIVFVVLSWISFKGLIWLLEHIPQNEFLAIVVSIIVLIVAFIFGWLFFVSFFCLDRIITIVVNSWVSFIKNKVVPKVFKFFQRFKPLIRFIKLLIWFIKLKPLIWFIRLLIWFIKLFYNLIKTHRVLTFVILYYIFVLIFFFRFCETYKDIPTFWSLMIGLIFGGGLIPITFNKIQVIINYNLILKKPSR